jgi:hypothetical protein
MSHVRSNSQDTLWTLEQVRLVSAATVSPITSFLTTAYENRLFKSLTPPAYHLNLIFFIRKVLTFENERTLIILFLYNQ